MKQLAIGIDIGGTRTKMGLVDLVAGQVLDTLIYPTETTDAARFEQTIGAAIATFQAMATATQRTVAGVGIGVSSFVSADGTVDSTYGFMPFMDHYPLAKRIETRFNIPCRVDNDARLVALGEAVFGKGRGFRRVLVLTLGTGLGVGFVIAGRLEGRLPYGHMGGHITVTANDERCYCGKTGCLESLVSATGLVRAAERLGWSANYPGLPLTAEQVFRQSEAGHPDARRLVDQLVAYLNMGIDNYINLFAPDIIILGGGVAKGLKPYISDWQNPNLLRPFTTYQVVIETSTLDEQSGILGSALLFTDEI